MIQTINDWTNIANNCEKNWLANNQNKYDAPMIYGTFRDNDHYLKTLDLLLKCTLETKNRINFFEKKIMPTIQHHHMLDVGVGDGLLAKLLGQKFSSITLVDPSIESLATVNESDFSHHPSINKLPVSMIDVELPNKHFDLALLSHCLYYIDGKQWMTAVQKIFHALKPGGAMVIVLNGGLDKDHLATKFNGHAINIESLARDCSNQLSLKSIKLIYGRESFITYSIEAMMHIVGLHLYDVGATASKESLITFVENLHTELYKFHLYQKFIVIRK